MPALFEDTGAGATDITGDPPPVSARTPNEVRGDQKARVNQKRAPTPGGDSAPESPPDQTQPPSPDKQDTPAEPDPGKSFAAGNAALAAQKPFKNLNPFSPIDWVKQAADDAWLTYQTGRRVAAVGSAFLDPHALQQSVHNIYEQDSARAKLMQTLLTAATGGEGMTPQAAEGRAADAAGGVLPLTGNPLNALGGSNLGANLAIGAGQGVLSASTADEQTVALTWAAVTGAILGAGHIPPELRKPLIEQLAKWPELETHLKNLLGLHRDFNRSMVAGSKGAQSFIQEALSQGGIPERLSRVASASKAAKAGQEFAVKGSEQRAIFKKAGVADLPELFRKAQEEGIAAPAAVKAIVDNYPALGLRYDLQRVSPGDVALGDPAASLHEIHNLGDPGRTGHYLASMNALEAWLGHVKEGLWTGSVDPAQAQLRALAGHNRLGGSTDLVYQTWLDSVKSLQRLHGLNGEQISKAAWGDKAAFDALTPEGKGVARQWRTISNAVAQESAATKYTSDFQGNWLPMEFKEDPLGARRSAGGRLSALTTVSKAHKAEAIKTDAAGRLVVGPKYLNAFAANADQSIRRSDLVRELSDPSAPLREELAKDAEATAIKASGDVARAQAYARHYYPHFETDFFKIAERGKVAQELKAIRTHQALGTFSEATAKDGQPLVVSAADAHARTLWAGRGYQALPGQQFANHLFHPDFHGDLAKYVDHAGKGLQSTPGFKQLLWLEGKSLAGIMFSPLIHSLNIATRFGAAAMMNPLEITHYLVHGRALSPIQSDVESTALRKWAIESGYVASAKQAQTFFDNLSARMGDALGSVEPDLESLAGDPNVAQRLANTHKELNRFFWNQYRDFGTMMTHIEYIAARKHGIGETDARLQAGARGKTWVGLSNPEDWNPTLHDALRLTLFAPAWWKSWIQLGIPYYRNLGLSKPHAAYAAYQGAKTAAAFLAFQKITGNLANFALTSSSPWAFDGHFQNQNLPGNQDRIEATAPWLDHVPGFAGIASEVGKTGGRRTLENPLGRQARDTEMAFGLQSGHPDWQPEDLRDGITKVMVSRLAPLLDGLAAAGNVDLYRSATSNSLAHVNPSQGVGLSPLSPYYAALMMSPLGSQWAEQAAAAFSDPQANQPTEGPFGQKVPKAMADFLGNTKTAAERTLFTWLTGTNPPYDYAEKSRGTAVSDAEYTKYAAAKTQYQNKMASLSAQALGGQIPPDKWLQQYKAEHAKYSAISSSTFKNAPHYVNGAEGMLNDYEALYDAATNPQSGEVDYAKLDALQAQFRAKPDNQAGLPAMDQLLHQQDQKFPMLALYHKTTAAYAQWQQQWASQNGVDINALRQEISEYGAMYGDQRASQRFLAQHHDLAQYEHAKSRQWETSPPGLLYGLFYNSSAVSRYMQARHLSTADVIQQEEAQSA